MILSTNLLSSSAFEVAHIKISYKDKIRKIVLPSDPSLELAEFIGILTGDGYMNYYSYQNKYLIEIAGDKRLDREYLCGNVSNLVKGLFGFLPSIYIRKDQNSMYLRIISKSVYEFLLVVGFKKGKKEEIGVPSWICADRMLMLAFLKGLADTDFSLHYRKDYPIISLSLKSKTLIEAVFGFLSSNGFRLTNYYKEVKIDKRGYSNTTIYKIRLNGEYNFRLWMEMIGFRNSRQKKSGTCGI
jgi:hypothetical protein